MVAVDTVLWPPFLNPLFKTPPTPRVLGEAHMKAGALIEPPLSFLQKIHGVLAAF